MTKLSTVYATNLYALASTLIHLRVPFSFRPHKTFGRNEFKSPFRKSTIDLELDDKYMTISDILYQMNEKYGGTFEFTIISEVEV